MLICSLSTPAKRPRVVLRDPRPLAPVRDAEHYFNIISANLPSEKFLLEQLNVPTPVFAKTTDWRLLGSSNEMPRYLQNCDMLSPSEGKSILRGSKVESKFCYLAISAKDTCQARPMDVQDSQELTFIVYQKNGGKQILLELPIEEIDNLIGCLLYLRKYTMKHLVKKQYANMQKIVTDLREIRELAQASALNSGSRAVLEQGVRYIAADQTVNSLVRKTELGEIAKAIKTILDHHEQEIKQLKMLQNIRA